MKKYKLAILKIETGIDHLPWVDSCQQKSECVDYDVMFLGDELKGKDLRD